MLTHITIEGFKSLLKIPDLELGRVNVFIGANGSGKSAFLEAFGVLGAAIAGRVDDTALRHRGVRPGVPALYKTSLKNEKYRRVISLKAMGVWEKTIAEYSVALDNLIEEPSDAWTYTNEMLRQGDQRLIGRSPAGKSAPADILEHLGGLSQELRPDAGLIAVVRGFKELDGAPHTLLQVLENYAIFAPTTPVLRGIEPDSSQREPLGLSGGRLPEALEQILDAKKRRFGDLNLDDVLELLDWVDEVDVALPSKQFLSPNVPTLRRVVRFTDKWMRQGRNRLSAYDASEGSLYVLFMLALAAHSKSPQLFAIDNFDQAMHPTLARQVTRLFCQAILASKRQVLLTTHNPLVLDGLNLNNPEIRLFAVERSYQTGGATKIYRVEIAPGVLAEAKDKGWTLSDLWVMGRIGAVPDL